MQEVKEKFEGVVIMTPEEADEKVKSSAPVPKVSNYRKEVLEYAELLNGVPNGGGIFFPSENKNRVKLRRRIKKASAILGIRYERNSHERDGEFIRVYRDEPEE